MEEKNMQELMNEYEEKMDRIEEGMIIEGEIFSIGTDDVVISLNHMFDGVANKKEIETELLEIGKKVKFEVVKIDDEHGEVILSRKGALQLEIVSLLNRSFENGTIINVVLIEEIKGGIRVDYKGMRGFMPFSQIDLKYVDDVSNLIGKEFEVLIIDWNQSDENLVVSRRKLLEISKEEEEKEFFGKLVIDEIYEGKVYKLFKAGALVDLGGAMGYLHINDMSWKRIKNIEEIIKVGDVIKVQVKSFDIEEKRVGLSLKDISVNPWDIVMDDYSVGDVVYGKIIKDINSGLLIELETGVIGYIHKSQIMKVKWELGDEMAVEIESIDVDAKKIGLLYFDENAIADEYEIEDEEQTTIGDLFGDIFDKIDK